MTQEKRPDNYDEASPQSAELFHLIVENVKDYAIFMTDAEGVVVSWNPGVERVLGYTESEIVGQPIVIIFTPEDAALEAHVKEMEFAAQTGSSEDKRWHVRRNGSRFWANGMVMPLKNADGTLRGFAKVMRDDTAHKLAEDNLKQILSAITDAFYRFDRDFRFTYVNRATTEMFNLAEEEFLGKTVFELFPDAAGNKFHREIARALSEQETIVFDNYYEPLDRWFENRVYPSADGLSVFTSEITGRKRSEEKLRQSEERYRSIVNQTVAGIAEVDLTGRFLTVNDRLCEIVGYAPEELLNFRMQEITHADDLPGNVKQFNQLAQDGAAFDIEKRYLRKDGSIVWVQNYVSVIRDVSGKPQSIVAVINDITTRKRAEENLKHQKTLLESLTESVLDGIIIISPEGKILHFNRHFLDIWNFPAEIIESKSDERALEWAANQTVNPAEFLARVNKVYEQPDGEVREELLMNDGRVYERFGAPILSGDVRLGWVWTFRDITESKRAETNLALLAEISQDLARLNGVDEIMQTVCAKIGAYLDLSACAFVEIYEAANEAIINHAWNREDAPKLIGIYRLEDFLTDEFQTAARDGEMFIVRDTATDSRTDAARYATLKIKSFLSVPMVQRGDWRFLFIVNHSAPHDWRADEIELIRELTTRIWTRLERARAEDVLRESEEQLHALVDSIPQLAWMAEPDGFIFWYNRRWYDYTGTTPEEMAGWGWQSVHDADMLPSVLERWQASIQTGKQFEMEFPLRGRDGRFRWFLTRVNPLRDSEGRIIRWFGTNTDIDEQKRLNQRNQFIIRLDEAVRPLETAEEISLTMARLLGEYLDAHRCAYAEVEADEDHFVIPSDYTKADTHSIVGRYRMADFGAEVLRLMRANQPYVVHDVNTDAQVSESDLAAYRMTAIQAVVCVPLHKNNRFTACMAVHQKTPRRWLPEEVELVTFVANRFWESIERARTVKRLHESLARETEARRSAEDANRLKDEFLATLSHELRTPLNAILGWSQMLQTHNLGADETEKALTTIERSARAQNQLIDDILDVSRIITGKLRLDVRAVDLSSVIAAAIDAARPAAEAKNIRLQTLLDPQAGPISGDPDRIQQIVWNLLSNAVKFTQKDGRVQVRLERVNSHIEIVVSDTGRGIEQEFLPYVFDRFRQSDGSMTRRHGGLGLGLAIVRQLVELHGGSVSVESTGEGQGATFTVFLPLLPVRREPASDAPRVHPAARTGVSKDCPPELADLRVLLVDDEADSRELLNLVLDLCGAQVTTANSAAEAFGAFQREKFDIIVSDIGMPEEDGFSLISRIRNLPNERGGDVPAIALTAYARSEDRVQALRAGFQMHVAKPVEPSELAVVVANLAGRMRNPNLDENA